MAAPKRPTHVVVHKKLYMAPKGKLEHIEAGTELVLDKETAKKLGNKVRPVGEEKAIDFTGIDFSKMDLKQLKKLCKKAKLEFADDAKEEDLIKLLEAQA